MRRSTALFVGNMHLCRNCIRERIFVERVQEALELLSLLPDDSASHAIYNCSHDHSHPVRLLNQVDVDNKSTLTKRSHTAGQPGENPTECRSSTRSGEFVSNYIGRSMGCLQLLDHRSSPAFLYLQREMPMPARKKHHSIPIDTSNPTHEAVLSNNYGRRPNKHCKPYREPRTRLHRET